MAGTGGLISEVSIQSLETAHEGYTSPRSVKHAYVSAGTADGSGCVVLLNLNDTRTAPSSSL